MIEAEFSNSNVTTIIITTPFTCSTRLVEAGEKFWGVVATFVFENWARVWQHNNKQVRLRRLELKCIAWWLNVSRFESCLKIYSSEMVIWVTAHGIIRLRDFESQHQTDATLKSAKLTPLLQCFKYREKYKMPATTSLGYTLITQSLKSHVFKETMRNERDYCVCNCIWKYF